MTPAFDLNKHTARLLMDEPFFAALSRRIDKRSSTAIPTAGVKVDKETGHFVMIYNPEFFDGLTDKQKLGVLITLSLSMSPGVCPRVACRSCGT